MTTANKSNNDITGVYLKYLNYTRSVEILLLSLQYRHNVNECNKYLFNVFRNCYLLKVAA